MKRKVLYLFAFLFLILACTKRATIHNISYNKLNEMIKSKENFILAVVDDNDKDFISFNNNIKKIVNDYNINIYYIKDKDISKIFNIDIIPTVIFIENGIETNDNNRIVGDISYSRMIDIFKKAEYID